MENLRAHLHSLVVEAIGDVIKSRFTDRIHKVTVEVK
jgi:hypothetical protein